MWPDGTTNKRQLRLIVQLIVLTLLHGCEADVAPQSVDVPLAADSTSEVEMSSELNAIYRRLNLRSLRSSLGPRLKFHCESYLSDFFPPETVSIESANRISLSSGDDVWMLELLGTARIRLDNQIVGATYSSTNEYLLYFDEQHDDWRATETWIQQRPECKPLHPTDARPTTDTQPPAQSIGWVCGAYWRSKPATSTPEYFWRSLPEADLEWGLNDMLRLAVKMTPATAKTCNPGEQSRRVDELQLFDEPHGTVREKLVQISTYDSASATLGVVGWIESTEGTSRRARFDILAKENPVLLISDRRDGWVNIASPNEAAAWLSLESYDNDQRSATVWFHQQRLLAADEITFRNSTRHSVRSAPDKTAAELATISGDDTLMLATAIDGEWLQVRYVLPPAWPLLSCGDDESDFEWLEGWIRWRVGTAVMIEEEHHYGC